MIKKILVLLLGKSDTYQIAYKDAGMLLYKLSVNYNWESTYVCFKDNSKKEHWNSEFLNHVQVSYISDEQEYQAQVKAATKYIKEEIKNYDVIIFFNYSSATYYLAKCCKKFNKNIKVISKLDMGIGGFSHFSSKRPFSTIRHLAEKIRSKSIDLFTVETGIYFNELKDTIMFRNRLKYLPNGVSLLGIESKACNVYDKENIIVTVGRLGDYAKNTELLINAVGKIPLKSIKGWQVYLIGTMTKEFNLFLESIYATYPYLKNIIVYKGEISDRNQLYDIYKKSKIICMPSRTESTCIATLEGLYFGNIPVITRYSEFVNDTTRDGEYGYIVEHASADSLANTLLKAIEESHLNDRNEQIMCYAREKFDYDVLAKQLNEYLEELG